MLKRKSNIIELRSLKPDTCSSILAAVQDSYAPKHYYNDMIDQFRAHRKPITEDIHYALMRVAQILHSDYNTDAKIKQRDRDYNHGPS